MEYTFSKHAIERFAERMQDYDSQIDVNVFVATHESEIKERITKLIQYSSLIYTGRSTNDYNKEIVDVYLNRDGWVIIIDHKKNNVITIFNITLGLDDELDKLYLQKVSDRLEKIKELRAERLESIESSRRDYQQIVDETKVHIQELRTELKNLETIETSYKEVISNLQIQKDLADKELKSFIAKILGKKVF